MAFFPPSVSLNETLPPAAKYPLISYVYNIFTKYTANTSLQPKLYTAENVSKNAIITLKQIGDLVL